MELSILIATLKHGKFINQLSWLIFMTTAICVGYFASMAFAIIAILSAFILVIAQSFYALRTSLDYEFFQILHKETPNIEHLKQFDEILLKHQFIKNLDTHTIRSLDSRIAGAMRLIKSQVIYLGLQILLFMFSLIVTLLIQ